VPLCFLHGLDSSPRGTKARLLREYDPDIWIPALPPDISQRLRIAEEGISAPMLVVGSSLGGLTAILFGMRHPERVQAMVLMAPAVGSRDPSILADREAGLLQSLYIPQGIPTVIVAGLRDELIPVSAVRALIDRSPCPGEIHLHEVDDDHNLHHSLDLMLRSIDALKKGIFEAAGGP